MRSPPNSRGRRSARSKSGSIARECGGESRPLRPNSLSRIERSPSAASNHRPSANEGQRRPVQVRPALDHRKPAMKLTMDPDMIEATRLTREGRLSEATALLQRMLASGAEADRADATASGPPPTGAGPIIELTPEMIEVSAPRPFAPTASVEADARSGNESTTAREPLPGSLRGLVEKIGRIGSIRSRARGPSARSPADPPELVPKGGRFVTATFANP